MWNDRRRTRVLLGIAFIARLIFAIRFSYLHPDEHLQGPQEIAHGSFGWASQYPWEFRDEHPLRSYLILWLAYGIPMSFFSADSNPIYVLSTLRVVLFASTWILEDMAVDRLVNTRKDKLRSLFFVSTSYVTWTWQAHTLSNSLETVLVLWFLVILHEAESASVATFMSPFDRHYDNFLAGLIVVLGVFNRPTFLAFLILPSLRFLRLWFQHPSTLVTFALSATVACGACIYTDTLLYGSQQWVITPLNFIKYNLSAANLSQHGTHNRLTHALVNLPQLIGPGLLLLNPRFLEKTPRRFSIPVLSILGGLGLLSYFTHQEARFLLPLVPLLCMQMDFEQFSSEKVRSILLYSWIIFNLVLGVVMGMFHQAGVTPAQVEVRQLPRPSTVLWWKTYTPPLWLTGLQGSQVRYSELGIYGVDVEGAESFLTSDRHDDEHSRVMESNDDVLTVFDLQGSSPDTMRHLVKTASVRDGGLYLVAPLAKAAVLKEYLGVTDPLWYTVFHLDPDLIDVADMATLKLGLGIYNLTSIIV